MKTKCTFLFLLLFNLTYYAQLNPQNKSNPVLQQNHQNHEKCGFNSFHEEMMQSDPAYLQKTQEINEFIQNFIPNKSAATYVIPVVVHVISDGTSLTDISDEQIQLAIRGLNERMRKLAGGLGDGNGVDVGIEYALAVRTPGGACTNGIVRYDYSADATYTTSGVRRSGGVGTTDATLKALSVWDQTKYYNMWLVSEIDNNEGGTGTQGYAQFASGHGGASDGAVMLANCFRNPGGTTLIHELGHSLNLYHTFQGDGAGGTCPTDAVCGTSGDCCADIPPHKRSSSDCLINTNDATCGNVDRDLYVHNYMDYSSDACQNEFTADQKTRMLAAMVTRASFFDGGNMALVPVSAPTAAFGMDQHVMCGTGQSITLYDMSTCSPNTFMEDAGWSGITYDWTVTNGTTTYTSTKQNPIITIADAGTYDVTLEITNGQGTDTYTETGAIIVGATPTAGCTPVCANAFNSNQTASSVSFNTILHGSSKLNNTVYTDMACTKNTVVDAGSSYTLSVDITAGGSGSENIEVYIDYNNDGVFANPGELIMSGSTAASTYTTVSSSIAIPSSGVTTNTLLRMRVLAETNAISNNDRTCGANLFICDVKDFGVYIYACSTPTVTASTPGSRCDAGTVDLTATPSAGTIKWYDAAVAGNLLFTGTNFTTPSIGTTTTYYAEAVDASCVSAARTAVVATIGNCTQLRTPYCAKTLTNFNDYMACDAVGSATAYRFEMNDGTNTYTYTSATYGIRFNLVPGIQYGTTYAVRCASQVGGNWSAYGPSCNVTTPLTQIESWYCGITETDITKYLACYAVEGATQYRFEVSEGANVYTYTSTGVGFRMSNFANIKYNTTYSVRAAAYVGGAWGAYGAACNITTPLTKIQSWYCGITASAMTQYMACYTVNGATQYSFKLVDGGTTLYYTSTGIGFRFSYVPGIQINTTYSVSVAAYVGGVWSAYGDACNITSAASLAMNPDQNGPIGAYDGELMGDDFIEAYPNPSTGEFVLTVSQPGEFIIVNELGQVLKRISLNEENNLSTIVSDLEKGIYFVTGVIHDERITKKVIVMK